MPIIHPEKIYSSWKNIHHSIFSAKILAQRFCHFEFWLQFWLHFYFSAKILSHPSTINAESLSTSLLAKIWSKMPKWTIFGKIHINIWQHCSNISHFRFLYQVLPEYTFGAKFLGILAFSENIWLKSHINIWPAHYFTTSVSCWYLSQPKLNLSSVTQRPPKRTHLQEAHRWISAHHFRFLLARLPESGI